MSDLQAAVKAAEEALTAFDEYADTGAPVSGQVGAAYGKLRALVAAVKAEEPEWEYGVLEQGKGGRWRLAMKGWQGPPALYASPEEVLADFHLPSPYVRLARRVPERSAGPWEEVPHA